MKIVQILAGTLALATVFNACKKDDPPLPDNLVQFEAAEQGFDVTAAEATIKVKLSRAADAAATVKLSLAATGIGYTTQFITEPAATAGVIALPVAVGATEASFKVKLIAGTFLSGSEAVKFTIADASPLFLGTIKELNLKFGAIVSTGTANYVLSGLAGSESGASAGNSVFVDMSNNAQTPLLRTGWDLGFLNTADFRVVLNNTVSAGAKVLDKNDLAAVVAADTVGLTLSVNQMAPAPTDFNYFDDIDGDITKTVIPAVSATAADNKVIIINRGTGGGTPARAWKKIRVLRNASGGYTVQYANITDATFQTVDIAKDEAYNFKLFSFDNGAVSAGEPKKKEWDIQWTYSVFKTDFGGGSVPYNFSDLVNINYLAGVQVAKVLTSAVTYDAYAESNIATSTFTSGRWDIGSGWRTATSGASPSVLKDQFYVIKDPNGNYYKLKFISFHAATDGGVRGKPVIEYKLVKKA